MNINSIIRVTVKNNNFRPKFPAKKLLLTIIYVANTEMLAPGSSSNKARRKKKEERKSSASEKSVEDEEKTENATLNEVLEKAHEVVGKVAQSQLTGNSRESNRNQFIDYNFWMQHFLYETWKYEV